MSLWICLIGIAVILIALFIKTPTVVKNRKILTIIGLVLIFWPFIWLIFGILISIVVAIIVILILIWLFKKIL